jgi:hypothetical protein
MRFRPVPIAPVARRALPVRVPGLLVPAFLALALPMQAEAGVYRCNGPDGKVLYSNEPCEAQGAKTAKTFKKSELRPNTVKMPKAPPPPEDDTAAAGGGLVESLRQKPIDIEQRMREGNPDDHPKGGRKVNPLIEKLLGKK